MSTRPDRTEEKPAPGHLRRDAVGIPHVIYFVVAVAAPLATVAGVSPAAFAFGNGPGVPLTFLLVGGLYLLFSAGFTAMSRFMGGAVGFYPYLVRGLGRPAGAAGAFLALATYNAVDVAVYGMFGFFANAIGKEAGGPDLPWWLYAAALAPAVYACGRRRIEISGRLLAVCLAAEVAILLALCAAVLLHGGPEGAAAALTPFGPRAMLGPGFGVTLVFVVTAFIGFEATVAFAGEARNPRRTVPRATYAAVVLLALFYALTSWCVALHYGPAAVQQAAKDHPATLYLAAVQARLGTAAGTALNGLLLVSLFACALSLHNAINRYVYAAARDGLLWPVLARVCPRHLSPHVAGRAQTALALGGVALFALCRQDPYAVVFGWMGTLASLGILALQILVSLAVVGFFRRSPREVGPWHRLAAPLLAAGGLGICLALMIAKLPLVSGSDSPVVRAFPFLLAGAGLAGTARALWLRAKHPALYRKLARNDPPSDHS